MAANNTQTVSIIVNRITAMQAGFQKDFTPKMGLVVEGVNMLQPAILAELATDLALYTAADAARTALSNAVAAKKAAGPGIVKFLDTLETLLKQQFGSGAAELQDFGIKPPKARKVLTAEEKAVAVAKGTKKARGIMGKNQRGAITAQGKPGLVLVSPTGTVVPGAMTGPTPPGSGTPVTVDPATVTGGSAPAATPATDSQSGPPAPAAPATPANGSTPDRAVA